ncbi:MAG TPA: hypothetical protein VHZ26_05255 [Caulobacteraceae bacterium]|nr:hypothetical protein [Caulobacteraceae bacterium]
MTGTPVRAARPNLFVSPEQIVRKSIILARADKAQHVTVAGPDSLAAMVALCRAGFDHVECARQATCACADEVSDVLLVVGPQPPRALADLLARTCRLLRDGGVLVAQLEAPGDAAAVRRALEQSGRRVGSTVLDLATGRLVSHTVERIGARRTPAGATAQRATSGE